MDDHLFDLAAAVNGCSSLSDAKKSCSRCVCASQRTERERERDRGASGRTVGREQAGSGFG